MTDDFRIDPGSWQVTVLPLPKRHSRGSAFGFCAGHPVGCAETAHARNRGCWWPAGAAELLVLDGYDDVETGRAAGAIPGHWRQASGAMGAACWTVRDGRLFGTVLHDASYERTWATGSGGGTVVGIGKPRAEPGQRVRDVGLVWRDGAPLVAIAGAGHVALCATDCMRLGGSLDGRAALWPSADAAPVDLAPAGMNASSVEALDGDVQVGIAWKGMRARAALWRGTAASYRDLTPKGHEVARAYGGAGGFQVGFVRRKDTTRNGSTGCDNRAALWQGAADAWMDLNGLLPANRYNASVAWGIEMRGDDVRICGEASRCETRDPGTAREAHYVPVAHPVLWTARLR